MNTDLILSDIFKASRREMLQYAFWRVESAIIIALTIVMTGLCLLNIFFLPEMGWMWLGFGVLGEAALIYTGTQDKVMMAKLASKLFYTRLGPNEMQTPQLKHAMSAALDFHRGVFGVVSSGKFTNLGELAIDMDHWVAYMFRIVGHLDQVITTPSVLPPGPATLSSSRKAAPPSAASSTSASRTPCAPATRSPASTRSVADGLCGATGSCA